MPGIRVEGNTSGNVAEVDASNRLLVRLPDATTAANVGGVRLFSENDPGAVVTPATLLSPETDDDYRLRVAQDTLLDEEVFNYTAQNTGKSIFANTTLAATWNTGGLLFNSGSITTTTTGARYATRATFPLLDPGNIAVEAEVSFSAQPVANTIVDFGLFLDGGSNPFAPTDGVFFRLTSAGLFGVINHNGTETTTSVMSFTYVNSQVYSFLVTINERSVFFWIDNVLYGKLTVPVAQGQIYMSESLPFAMRHAIVGGAAGAVFQPTLRSYSIAIGGLQIADSFGDMGNRVLGSYQGQSGGTMGTLASYANSADPTAAAALSNTAALVTGLGGQFRFNAAATAVTDGIVVSYQVPAATVSTRNRRLKVTGVYLNAVNTGAAVATTATTIQWSLAFGHTAVALNTAEAATTKAARRVALGITTWPVGAAIGAGPQENLPFISFAGGPIYVNPGEFFQLVAKFIIGTATASQVIWGTFTPVYSWE